MIIVRRLGHFGIGFAGALLAAGCPADEQAEPKDDAGVTKDVNVADADAGSDWDPVWHLTEPKAWQTIGPEGQPDCGVGCRMLLNARNTTPNYYAFSFDSATVLSEGSVGLMSAKLDGSPTVVYGPQAKNDEAVGEPYLLGQRATYMRNFGPGHGQVEVMDLVTGETKIAYAYTPATAGTNNVTRTALNSHYVFWAMDGQGIMSRELQSGEVKLWMPGSYLCHDICATEHQLLCADIGVVYSIDLDTDKTGFLDNGGALQIEGFCSPDRTQFVWIDYRDPPGQDSTYEFSRSGGEVYLRDLGTNKTRRVTYDSPASPHGKNFPAVDGSRVFWNQTPDGPDQNPNQASDLYYRTTVLVRFDLSTGQKCKLGGAIVHGYKAAYGSKMVTLWRDPAKNEIRVVLIDLDDPGLLWQCETVAIPP